MQVELPGRLVGVAGRCVSERPLNGVHQGSRCFAFQFLDLQGPDLDYLSRFVLEWDVEHKLLDPGA
jgi:hypothetical protein